MTNPSKNKGDRGERELAKILSDELGVTVRRKLGAGRKDDVGDLDGLPGVTCQAKNYASVTEAINVGLKDLARNMENSGDPLGVCLVRRPGGRWIAVMDVSQWCAWYRETL